MGNQGRGVAYPWSFWNLDCLFGLHGALDFDTLFKKGCRCLLHEVELGLFLLCVYLCSGVVLRAVKISSNARNYFKHNKRLIPFLTHEIFCVSFFGDKTAILVSRMLWLQPCYITEIFQNGPPDKENFLFETLCFSIDLNP